MKTRSLLASLRKNLRINQTEGFSLVEALMSLCIMCCGMLAVAQLLFVSIGSPALARSKAAATLAAQNKLEFLADAYRLNPEGADLTLGNHGPEFVTVRNPVDNKVLNRFRIVWAVAQVPDPRAWKTIHAKRVSVTASPVDNGGTAHDQSYLNKVITMTSIFSVRPNGT